MTGKATSTPDDSLINPFFLAMLGSITRASADEVLTAVRP
jgi:hypothetical protein